MPSNCPAIAQAYSKKCRDAQGGVQKFYVTEHANIASYTEASGVLTAITMVAGKKFWLYEQELNTANFTETPTPNRQAGTNFTEMAFVSKLLKRDAATSYSLRALGQQDLVIIEVEQTGTAFICGIKNGMALEPSPSGTGTNMGDESAYNLTFKGQEPYPAFTISQALIDSVIV